MERLIELWPRWNPSWNFRCGVPRTWHSAGRGRGRSPSKGGWIWKGRTCFTRWWGQGHPSQSRTNTNCCSWFEPAPRSWAKPRCCWTSNDLDCFALVNNAFRSPPIDLPPPAWNSRAKNRIQVDQVEVLGSFGHRTIVRDNAQSRGSKFALA